VSVEDATERLTASLSLLANEGVPRESFDRIKKRWLQTSKREGTDSNEILWRAWSHLSQGLEPNNQADHLKRIESITLSDVNSLINALGNPQRRIVGLIKGE